MFPTRFMWKMQPSAAGWSHFHHLYQRIRLHAVIPGKWSLSNKLVIWHLGQQDLPTRLGVFVPDLMVYVIRVLLSNPQRMKFSLGIICYNLLVSFCRWMKVDQKGSSRTCGHLSSRPGSSVGFQTSHSISTVSRMSMWCTTRTGTRQKCMHFSQAAG